MAFEAGADLLLMPADVGAALEALVQGEAEGRWPADRLEASLERRRRALASCRPSTLTVAEALDGLVEPTDRALAESLVDLSLQGQGVPRRWRGPGVNLLRIDNSLSCPFLPLTAPALVQPLGAGLRTVLVDGQSQPLDPARLPDGPVLLQLFVRGNPFRGSAGAADPWPRLVRQLLAEDRLEGLAIYGSPYVWEALRNLLPADLPAAYSPGQMPAAQARVLQRLGLGTPTDGKPQDFTD
jgi:beta-glucosidase